VHALVRIYTIIIYLTCIVVVLSNQPVTQPPALARCKEKKLILLDTLRAERKKMLRTNRASFSGSTECARRTGGGTSQEPPNFDFRSASVAIVSKPCYDASPWYNAAIPEEAVSEGAARHARKRRSRARATAERAQEQHARSWLWSKHAGQPHEQGPTRTRITRIIPVHGESRGGTMVS
jgi:hypothetical protein